LGPNEQILFFREGNPLSNLTQPRPKL
jgi:hypothetical protein